MNDAEIENFAAEAIKTENYSEARRLLEPLAKANSEYALLTLGWIHESGKGAPLDYSLAATYYDQATKIGCLEAFSSLGRVLWADNKLKEAREKFKEGAELGNLGCMAWFGIMVFSGKGGAVDLENGILWINAAAEKGHFAAKGQVLIIEKNQSKSIFRHIVYHFKRIFLALRVAKEYLHNPYSNKVF